MKVPARIGLNTAYERLAIAVRYYPYGVCLESQGDPGTDRLFTGQRLDSTGLYYYGARYYDPTIGRFISPDTVVPDPMKPQAFNRYSYLREQPAEVRGPRGTRYLISMMR